MPDEDAHPRTRLQLLGAILAVACCVFLWSSLLTFDAGDWPSPHQFPHNQPAANACGLVGAYLAHGMRHYLGDGAYPLLLFSTFAALTKLVRGRVGHAAERVFGVGLLVACTSSSVHLISSPQDALLPVGNGGVIGFALGELLLAHVSSLGTVIILTAGVLVGLVFATEGWVLRLPVFLSWAREATGGAIALARSAAGHVSPFPGWRRQTPVSVASGVEPTRTNKGDRLRVREAPPRLSPARGTGTFSAKTRKRSQSPSSYGQAAHDADESAVPSHRLETGATSEEPVVVNFPRRQDAPEGGAYPRRFENWELPSLSLLEDPEYGFTSQQEVVVREKAKVLERTLEEFRLDAHVVEIDTGPVITMFELRLAPGVKVSQIAALSNDIARALKAPAIRVVAPIPGKNTIGIEVPNPDKEMVRLRELMLVAGERASKMALPIFIGKNASGEVLVTDLAVAPHMLIAGTTGSGKSVCMNSLIVSLLMTKPPDRVKLILVDPKMVELSQFRDVPHLMCPIVTDMVRAEKILGWAVTKMDERYELLAEAGVRHISAFNALGKQKIYARFNPRTEQEKSRIPTHIPYIVIMIDELADLMMTAAKKVEHHLSRLAQKSRAVGVHIVVATQRPEAKIVTGLIKSNLPCRIAFRVASRMDSRIVLDQNGGEVLMGQGDMLFLPPGSHKLMRCQGTFVSDDEIHAVIDDLTKKGRPEFHPELGKIRAHSAGNGPGRHRRTHSAGDGLETPAECDPLFNEAVEVVLQSKRGSVSLLQRRLTIGYSRASRLIDEMAEAGIVGDYKGSQAREVTITPGEWKALQSQNAETSKR